MKILGIDPGSRKTGYALIEFNSKKINYLDSGVICFNEKENFLDRIDLFYSEVGKIIDKYSPDEVAIESLIFVKSPTALIKLAQIRGAMIASIQKSLKGKIFEYSPNLIKQTATGYGHATKDGVKKLVDMVLGSREYKTDDESDALAVAICHAIHRNGRHSEVVKNSSVKKRTLSGSLSHAVKKKRVEC